MDWYQCRQLLTFDVCQVQSQCIVQWFLHLFCMLLSNHGREIRRRSRFVASMLQTNPSDVWKTSLSYLLPIVIPFNANLCWTQFRGIIFAVVLLPLYWEQRNNDIVQYSLAQKSSTAKLNWNWKIGCKWSMTKSCTSQQIVRAIKFTRLKLH